MIRKLILKIFGPLLLKMYRNEIQESCEKLYDKQLSDIQDLIFKGLESGLELNIIINPYFGSSMGMFLSSDEDEDDEETKENPFTLVKNEEE